MTIAEKIIMGVTCIGVTAVLAVIVGVMYAVAWVAWSMTVG